MTPLTAGGVIAAGEGSRLKAIGRPKPLVSVAGLPLIERVLSNFAAAGIAQVSVLFNAEQEECAAFVRDRFADLVPVVVQWTTPHSLESLRTIFACTPTGRLLVATVDTICATEDFVAFARAAAACDEKETILAVTPLVADEKPLWVGLGPGGRVTSVGGAGRDAVTAGFYVFSARARDLEPPASLGRLREYLGWLCDSGEPMRAVPIAMAVDVDRPEDVLLAEELFGRAPRRTAGGGA